MLTFFYFWFPIEERAFRKTRLGGVSLLLHSPPRQVSAPLKLSSKWASTDILFSQWDMKIWFIINPPLKKFNFLLRKESSACLPLGNRVYSLQRTADIQNSWKEIKKWTLDLTQTQSV